MYATVLVKGGPLLLWNTVVHFSVLTVWLVRYHHQEGAGRRYAAVVPYGTAENCISMYE